MEIGVVKMLKIATNSLVTITKPTQANIFIQIIIKLLFLPVKSHIQK